MAQAALLPSSPSAATLELTNAERAAADLAPLEWSSTLADAAAAHSADQASRNTMSHTGSDGTNGGARITRAGFAARAWGENVAAGYDSAPSVLAGWMESPGHRENILGASFTHLGVAYAQASDGTWYWTMVLAA